MIFPVNYIYFLLGHAVCLQIIQAAGPKTHKTLTGPSRDFHGTLTRPLRHLQAFLAASISASGPKYIPYTSESARYQHNRRVNNDLLQLVIPKKSSGCCWRQPVGIAFPVIR